MISRFGPKPSISDHHRLYYEDPMKMIHSAMEEIRTFVSKPCSDSKVQSQGIQRILSLMTLHADSLSIQRIGCHAISNLAMSASIAKHIVALGAFDVIRSSLLRFDDDHQLCWLGSSAIWNLSRPPTNRTVIGKDGVDLMLSILRKFRSVERVVNTSIGALSNLSLCHSLKGRIAEEETMDLFLSVLNDYGTRQSVSVLASGTGLINNLGVNDDYATMLVEKGSLKLLIGILKWDKDIVSVKDGTLYRNACSALNNLIDAEQYIESFLEHRALEVIRSFLDRENASSDGNSNNNDSTALCMNLLQNCLMEIEMDPMHRDTTSFHLCAARGNLSILKKLVADDPCYNLDAVDSNGCSCLDHAVSGRYIEMVTFLSKCGAVRCTEIKDEDEEDTVKDGEGIGVKEAVLCGQEILQEVVEMNRKVLTQILPDFPIAVCQLMTTFVSNVDLLKASGKFKRE